jgi:hypothetical protein
MARIQGLADLGHQPGFTWAGGDVDSSYKYEITYELVNTAMEDGRPFWVSEDMTNTDNERGKLRQRCMAAGIAMKDIEQLLDKPVMLTLELNDKGYPKIVNVAGVPAGMDVPQLSNGALLFDIYSAEPDMEAFHAMPEFKQNKITSALDFKETELYVQLTLEGEVEDESL